MAPLSREAAQAIIASIRQDNGGISPEAEGLSPPEVLRALKATRRKLASATTILAIDINSKDTRFVYELIQNAEDNSYACATADEEKRYLSFSIYPDRIVIDSNEDGFCEEHVKAICSAGESTKATAQGYIGEKGIVFKSVFTIAKKVHIQSGSFSFSFKYTKDSSDTGLEMITPLDEEYEELPQQVRTRITLTLLDSTFEERVHDLLNIPDALLLFLKNIEVLNINVYPDDGSIKATKITYVHEFVDSDFETIVKNTTLDGDTIEKTLDFYVIRKPISDLPPDPSRPTTNQATVILAFPVNAAENSPVIEAQHVFAYLPLRLAGFTFLIQSDFITQPSREDVLYSPRNKDLLLRGVAETFRDAVENLCYHPILQYQWMRYLPSESISDEFWGTLRPRILSLLSETRCLRSWTEDSLHIPSLLNWVGSEYKDQYGEPLFADLEEEGYLSKNYAYADFNEHLKGIGCGSMNDEMLIERIREDLQRPSSIMKALYTDEDWHSQTATTLLRLCELPNFFQVSPIFQALKALPLVPMQNGSWITIKPFVYFPKTEDVPIPTDLGYDLVQPAATLNPARKTLFSRLGVTNPSPNHVVFHINDKYAQLAKDPTRKISWRQHFSHLKYLYWYLPRNSLKIDENIYLLNQDFSKITLSTFSTKGVYFKEVDEEYGPYQLFRSIHSNDSNPPGFDVNFLNAAYFDEVPTGTPHHGRTWKLWLKEFGGVQDHPQLLNPIDGTLSNEFKYILQHRSEKLVGLLKLYWSLYEPQMCDWVAEEMKICCVPVGGSSAQPLGQTFLPSPKLRAVSERLIPKSFQFLILPEQLTDMNETEWNFLNRFNVYGEERPEFYMSILSTFKDQNQHGCNPEALNNLFKIYDCIERYCADPSVAASVRLTFQKSKFIYIPSRGELQSKWVDSEACVWLAPPWLESKIRLGSISMFRHHQRLFQVILKIGNANWKHCIEDLKRLKDNSAGVSSSSFSEKNPSTPNSFQQPYQKYSPEELGWSDYAARHRVSSAVGPKRHLEIYRRLWREFEHDSNWETIRTIFEEAKLVFDPVLKTWNAPSSCVWADSQIRNPLIASIKTPYASLRPFFCNVLGVQKSNPIWHVLALKELALIQPAKKAAEIKSAIMAISAMDPTVDDVVGLKGCNIFAVKLNNGQTTFTSSAADFAISDRKEYGWAFEGKIALLEYTVEEVHACQSFLVALGLKGRHLSELVEETTKVKHGEIDMDMSQRFRLKANALFRFSVHYRSQKSGDDDRTLLKQFQRVTMYVSDEISKSISVVQYGETVLVEHSRAHFHLEEDDNDLKLYVPRNQIAQRECYLRQFPKGLLKYLEISDPTAEAILIGIIGPTRLIVVNNILRDAGIVEIDGMESPPEYESTPKETESQLVPKEPNSDATGTPLIFPTGSRHDRVEDSRLRPSKSYI